MTEEMLIRYNPQSEAVMVSTGGGWRPPHPGELAGLAQAIDERPLSGWIEWGTVAAVFAAACVWLRGGGA